MPDICLMLSLTCQWHPQQTLPRDPLHPVGSTSLQNPKCQRPLLSSHKPDSALMILGRMEDTFFLKKCYTAFITISWLIIPMETQN